MPVPDVPLDVLDAVRRRCLALPDAHEEPAWTGTRWCVHGKNFAHAVMIDDGSPRAYAAPRPPTDPRLCSRSAPRDPTSLLAHTGPPFFKPVWFPDIVGLRLDGAVDWDEVTELVTESGKACLPDHPAPRSPAVLRQVTHREVTWVSTDFGDFAP